MGGWTPLLVACDTGHVTVVTALLDGGADIDTSVVCVSLSLPCEGALVHRDASMMGKGRAAVLSPCVP